jgi:hypothetical protein
MMGFGEMLKVSTLQHRAAPSGTLSQRILNSILKFDKMPREPMDVIWGHVSSWHVWDMPNDPENVRSWGRT